MMRQEISQQSKVMSRVRFNFKLMNNYESHFNNSATLL